MRSRWAGPLVSGIDVHRAVEDSRDDLAILDVRWYLDGRVGRDEYMRGHIPGAVFVDLDTKLAAVPAFVPSIDGRHPLPSPEQFARTLEHAGVDDDTEVVVYDDVGGSIAARLWWMLSALDHRVFVLDGGMGAYPGPLEMGEARPPGRRREHRTFTVRPWPSDFVVDAETVERLRREPRAVVLDARAQPRFRGDVEPIDARPGHIPGAQNRPWTSNLDPATGCFLAPHLLREQFASFGIDDADGDQVVVASCGSGVTACHNLLAMEIAGLRPGSLFVASWSGWAADPNRPAATGD